MTSFSCADVSVWCSDNRTGRRGQQILWLHTFATINFSVSVGIIHTPIFCSWWQSVTHTHTHTKMTFAQHFLQDARLWSSDNQRTLLSPQKQIKAEQEGENIKSTRDQPAAIRNEGRGPVYENEADLKIGNVSGVGRYKWGAGWHRSRRKAGTAWMSMKSS